MACLVLHNFLSLRDEEDDWLAEAIAKTVREEAQGGPNGLGSQIRDASAELESSQAMKQAGERLRTSLREVIARLPAGEHEED